MALFPVRRRGRCQPPALRLPARPGPACVLGPGTLFAATWLARPVAVPAGAARVMLTLSIIPLIQETFQVTGTVTVLTPDTYSVSTHTSSALAPPAGAASATLAALMNSTDVLAGPPNQCTGTIGIDFSYDSGGSQQSYRTVATSSWQTGPTNTVKGGTTAAPPNVIVPVPVNPTPAFVRGWLELDGQTFAGLTLTFTDASGNTL